MVICCNTESFQQLSERVILLFTVEMRKQKLREVEELDRAKHLGCDQAELQGDILPFSSQTVFSVLLCPECSSHSNKHILMG